MANQLPLSVRLQEAAAECNEQNVYKLVSEEGADVLEVDGVGNTALHTLLAFWNLRASFARGGLSIDSERLVRLLKLQAIASFLLRLIPKAMVDIKNRAGETCLHIAAQHPDLEVVCHALLEKGADVNAINAAGESVVYLAARRGSVEVAERLRERGGRIVYSPETSSPYLLHRLRHIVKRHQASLTGGGSGGVPAACSQRSVPGDVWSTLLQGGADAHVLRDDGRRSSPFIIDVLRVACGLPPFARVECIRICIERFGCDPRARTEMGETLLHVAAGADGEGAFSVLSYLLGKGCDISAKTAGGATPLHYALYAQHFSTASFLVAMGARGDGKATSGSCAAVQSMAKGCETPRQTLNTSPRSPVPGDASTLPFCVREKTGSIEQVYHTPFTLIWSFLLQQDNTDKVAALMECLELLLCRAQSVDLSGTDASGRSLLHMLLLVPAVDGRVGSKTGPKVPEGYKTFDFLCRVLASEQCEISDTGDLLYSSSIDVDARDARNYTPLCYAVKGQNTAAMLLLLQHGACGHAVGEDGCLPLWSAVRTGCKPLVRGLIDAGVETDHDDVLSSQNERSHQLLASILSTFSA